MTKTLKLTSEEKKKISAAFSGRKIRVAANGDIEYFATGHSQADQWILAIEAETAWNDAGEFVGQL